jgi:Flp pilus assembly protein TadD
VNPKNVSWAVALWTAFVCLTLPACESSLETAESPGKLPRALDGTTPRLNAATYAAHGELLERRGEYARAAEQYRKALEIAPHLTSTRNRLGVTLNKLGQHPEATAEFRLAIEAQPGQPFLWNNLGFSLYLEGDYDEAAKVLERTVELDPSFRRARMNYGVVLAQLERYDEALEQFGEAGPLGDAHFNLGVVQAQKGAYVAAASSFEQALANDPGLDAARDQLRQIARLTAVAENGGTERYADNGAAPNAGLAEATPTPAHTDAGATSEPAATAPTPTPAETAAAASPNPEPLAAAPVDERFIETVESAGTPPAIPIQAPVVPPADPRSSAVPPADAAEQVVAASPSPHDGARPSVPEFASIALENDPWAELFGAAPDPVPAARRASVGRVSPR